MGSNERDDLQDQLHTRKELLHRIMGVSAYTQEHPEMIQWAVNSRLERTRLCIENRGGDVNRYKIYLKKSRNKFV
jgi:hypothetical protein